MSGAPAETWRKFEFAESPPWAFWLGGAILAAITARRAGGYLPLTLASARSIRLVRWTPIVFVGLAVLFGILAAVGGTIGGDEQARSTVAVYAAFFGMLFVLLALFDLLLTHRFGPRGRVREMQPGHYEYIVELSKVHPDFVRAVRELQQIRATPRIS